MESEDLRVRRTKRLIKETFIRLIKEKGYENITVSDITRCAEINRKTFYLHYKNKSKLYKEIIIEMIGKFDMNLSSPDRLRVKNVNAGILQKEIEQIFKSIARNQELALILLKDPTTDYFETQLTYILTRDIFSLFTHRANNSLPESIPNSIVLDSLTAYLMIWVKWAIEQQSLQAEESARIICGLIQGCVFGLEEIDV